MAKENLTDFEREFEKQASRYYNYNGPDDIYAIRECSKKLMQKAKEELMKEAVEGVICGDNAKLWVCNNPPSFILDKFKDGDKVKLIFIKED